MKISMSTGNQQKLSLGEKLGYGCGDLASVLYWQTISAYLLFFYTDVFGLAAAAAGTMIAVSRIADAFFDVGIGIVADRTNTRWGKFRPYLLWMAVPLGLSAIFAFSTPDLNDSGKLIYAYATFMLVMFFYSAINIPYSSLLGVISSDPAQRTSASAFKFIGAYMAGFLVSATALPLAKYFGHGNDGKGWQMTVIIYAVLATIFFVITFLATKERVKPISTERTSIKRDLADIGKNGPWLKLFAITLLYILFFCIKTSVATHYFKYYVGEQTFSFFGKQYTYGFEWLASAFNTIGQAASIAGVIIVPWLARKLGKKNAVYLLLMFTMVCTLSYYFMEPQNVTAMLVMQFLSALSSGPIATLLWTMYADTADYSEWKTGRRATGLVYSASIMSTKLAWAIGAMIVGGLLSLLGFKANEIQNGEVNEGLKYMMSVIPIVAGIAAMIILFFYQLDDKKMEEIKGALEARRLEKGTAPV